MNQAVLSSTEEILIVKDSITSSKLKISEQDHGGCGAEEGLISVDQALELMISRTQPLATEIILM